MFKDKTTTIVVIIIAALVAYYFLFMNKKGEPAVVETKPGETLVTPTPSTTPTPVVVATPDVDVKLQENVNPPVESAFGDGYFNQLFMKGYV